MATASQAQRRLPRSLRVRIALVALLGVVLLGWLLVPGGRRNDLEHSLADCLLKSKIQLRPGQVIWLEPPRGTFAFTPVMFVGSRSREPDDVYYATARVDKGGTVFDVWDVTNVTRSSSASEGQLLRAGSYVAFSVGVGKQVDAVALLDLRGEPGRLTAGWPWRARLQNAITNLQETGRFAGFGRRHYRLVPPARVVTLHARGKRIAIEADDELVLLDPTRMRPIEGAERVDAQEAQKAQPGVITWVVDTVRNVPWIGAEPIAWLEHVVFGITDRARRTYYDLVGSDSGAEMQAALNVEHAAPVAQPVAQPDDELECFTPIAEESLLNAPEPDSALPPAPIVPVLAKPVKGEGEWLAVNNDPFVNAYPNAPAAFYQTFLRVDPERLYASVYVTLWDPRQVQLHLAMGTKEPESATGETGAGLVPREPEMLGHLVAGFNGGFQALHGEFGAMAEGRVYLPPKPYAATVAVFEDGRVGMGSWPGPRKATWDEESANAQIPVSMMGLRQNLTSVVEDGAYNPWRRWWWGAAPEDSGEQTYIARSGLCLTQEGHMAFLWGESMGPEALGQAMLALHCVRGIHLDMNTKHTGLEFYRPFAPDQAPPDLGRPLEANKEFETVLDQALGYRFRGRLAVKTMSPMRLPRYLLRDPRDFFYLTLKPVLPGPSVVVQGQSVAFSARGLPSAGWPYAFARASLAPELGAPTSEPISSELEAPKPRSSKAARAHAKASATWLVRIDPNRVVSGFDAPAGAGEALARLFGVAADATGAVALYTVRSHGLLRYAMGEPPARGNVVLRGEELVEGMTASRALAIDSEGFLLYAEAGPAETESLLARLREVGVRGVMALPDDARLAFGVDGKWVSVDGAQVLPAREDAGLQWWGDARPAAAVMFADTKPLPYYQWAGVQNQRVRYFPTGAPRFRAPDNAFKASPPSSAVAREPGSPVASRP